MSVDIIMRHCDPVNTYALEETFLVVVALARWLSLILRLVQRLVWILLLLACERRN